MTGEQKPGGLEVVARHHAERLLDNIACATQNRALLTGDPAEDKVLTEAVIENAAQEFEAAIRDSEARIDYLRTSRDGHAAESHKQFLRATAAEAKLARAVEGLQRMEWACEQLASTRSSAAYEQMISDGQAQELLELDNARREARQTLAALQEAEGKA